MVKILWYEWWKEGRNEGRVHAFSPVNIMLEMWQYFEQSVNEKL